MRKFLLVMVLSLALTGSAFAGGHPVVKKYYSTTNITNVTNVDDNSARNEFGAKLDAPNLVRLNKNWTVGTEGGHNFNGTSSNEGYFLYGKVTYSGTWFDFSK